MNLRKGTLMNFHYELGRWIVDNPSNDLLLTFGLQSTLVTIELVTMTTSEMLTF
jgi:hypothetical protein